MANNIRDWRVLKGITNSNHLMITFKFQDQAFEISLPPRTTYKDQKIEKSKLINDVVDSLGTLNGARPTG